MKLLLLLYFFQILSSFLNFCGFHTFAFFKDKIRNWVVGEPFKGDCNDICNGNDPGSTCDESLLIELDLQKAKNISISNGNQCSEWNDWNYEQGFSQCTSPDCCISGACQYHCSLAKAQKCVIPDGFNSDHSRICPCKSVGKSCYKIG